MGRSPMEFSSVETLPPESIINSVQAVTSNPTGYSFSLNDSLRKHYTEINKAPVPTPPVLAAKRSRPKPSPSLGPAPSTVNWNERVEQPTLRFSDLGGVEGCINDIRELIERPFRYPGLYAHLGVEPPRGVLLHGPPGCGKTCLAAAIAGELGVPLLRVAAPEVVGGMSGESEGRLRELFAFAKSIAPCILFLDEIDAITPKREQAQREMERRIVAQLLTCIDELAMAPLTQPPVIVLGATNRPDSLDPALRRAGRFDREIKLGIPDEAARLRILTVICRRLRIANDLQLLSIARQTPGYVGADLKSLTREAAAAAVQRIFGQLGTTEMIPEESFLAEHLGSLAIEQGDFDTALPKVQPSAKREGFAVVPDTTWTDVGALSYIRSELRMAIVEPIRHPARFAAVGITVPAGVLLWGPPGCGKTLLAKAVANESHCNFISVKGPELLNKYVGESERAVRQVFERARASAPCVVFFDELDALCPRRSAEGSDPSSRVVNQLLTEMDGLERRRQVFVLAATNRPDMIDPAMTRPGRLDKLLYVKLPTAEERYEILKTIGRKTPWHSEVELARIAYDKRCEGFSGADLAALIRESAVAAIQESLLPITEYMDMSYGNGIESEAEPAIVVKQDHVNVAFSKTFPSVSPIDQEAYNRLDLELRRSAQ